jgi:hypothetical protein
MRLRPKNSELKSVLNFHLGVEEAQLHEFFQEKIKLSDRPE